MRKVQESATCFFVKGSPYFDSINVCAHDC